MTSTAGQNSYPSAQRQRCQYAIRYIRWLSDSGAAMEIGPDAFAVLVAVASMEDEIHYSRRPNFFNEQLQNRCGIGSEPALIRARKLAIEAGLLDYEPGAKRRPGYYFTTGFPNESLAKPDSLTIPYGFPNDSLTDSKRIVSESSALQTHYPRPQTPNPTTTDDRPRAREGSSSVVVDLEGVKREEAAAAAVRIREAFRSIPRELAWRIAFVGTALGDGFIEDLLSTMKRVRNLDSPRRYITRSIERACAERGISWHRYRDLVQPCPPARPRPKEAVA